MDKRIEDKIDKISDDISEVKVTLARNTVSLEEHVKRTNILEARVEPMRKDIDMVKGAIALIGLLATIATIAALFR